MSIGDRLASVGRVIGHMENADELRAARARAATTHDAAMRRAELNDSLLGMQERTARDDFELARQMRAIPPMMTPGAAATPPVELDPRQMEGGDESIPGQPAIPPAPDVPGMYEARAGVALRNGRPDVYLREQQAAKAVRAEGVVELAHDILAGVSPAEAAQKFNARGNVRLAPESLNFDPKTGILSGSRVGPNGERAPFTLNPRQALVQYGAAKPDEFGHAGDVIYNRRTGQPTNQSSKHADAVDLVWQKAAAEHIYGGKGSGGDAPAKIREIEALIKDYKLTPEAAMALAYNEKDRDPTGHIVRVFTAMRNADLTSTRSNEEIMADAKRLVELAAQARQRPPVSGAAPKPAAPSAPSGGADIPLDDTGRPVRAKLVDKKVYRTAKGLARWDAPSGDFVLVNP